MKLLATLMALSGLAWVVVLAVVSTLPLALLVAAYVAAGSMLVRRTMNTEGLFPRLGLLWAVGIALVGVLMLPSMQGSGGSVSLGEVVALVVAPLLWGSTVVALWLVPALIVWSFIREGSRTGIR